MPIKNDPAAVQAQIHHALRNNILSSREAGRLLDEIKKDGVTSEEVDMVVDTLKAAMAGGPDSVSIDLSTSGRQKNLNRFLGRLNDEHALPLTGPGGARPAGTVNWIELMSQQSDATPQLLPEKSFGGNEVGVDANGQITLGGARIELEGEPTVELHEALWALNQPGQTMQLDDATKTALTGELLEVAKDHIGVANDAPGKFKKLVAVNAAVGAMADMAENWSPEVIADALDMAENAPNPMIKSVLLRGLGNAQLSPQQKTTLEAIEKPENHELLLKTYDETRNEQTRVGYSTVKDEAAQFALSALTFAKSEVSINNIKDGMKAWKDLNRDYSTPFDGEEIGNMNRILEAYVDKYPQTAYVYGTFSKNAPKEIANVTNARALEVLTPQLSADPPSLEGFPLTREQADYVKTLLPNIRDTDTAKNLVHSMATADAMFKERLPSTWGSPTLPEEPMAPAAFELFKRHTLSYNERASASKDGKLDYSDFKSSFHEQVKELHQKISPRMQELNGNPPTWGDTELAPEGAAFLKQQLLTHTRSTMSVDNLGRGLEIFSQKYGGKLEGAGLQAFQDMVTEYKANWPELKTFDFNKLERIASFKAEGREVPLCTINGQQIGLAEFYGKVGAGVSDAIDMSRQRHPWMSDRWGFRARQAVEVLDVVAEQAARDEGPVAELRAQFPGKTIEIQATGRDGAHEQFLYVVKDGNRTVERFNQASDGALAPFSGRDNPVLFTASVGSDGELNVDIPNQIDVHRYPLQTDYAVGDKIDIHYQDPNAEEHREEGEKFSTKSKVREAEITGYDAAGNYTVKFTTPEGDEKTKTLSMRDIRMANNPHYFKPKSSYFSDVTINLQTDKELATFLKEAQPIIDAYLPADGSTINMDPLELAKRQKECISALMKYTRDKVKYPTSKDSNPDEASQKYHELDEGHSRFPLGELIKIGKGVCRHQCILEHLLLQQAGIESRLASGSANTSSGNYRGLHIWTEVSLADGERYLSDQTWNDDTIPLWEGAYGTDKRRVEMYYRTARYDNQIERPN